MGPWRATQTDYSRNTCQRALMSPRVLLPHHPYFTARLTVILPPERPELRRNRSRACARFAASFLAAADVPATALVRIWRLLDPGEFGADRSETRTSCGHELRIAARIPWAEF